MKRIVRLSALGIGIVFIGILGMIFVRTTGLETRQLDLKPGSAIPLDRDGAVQRLAGSITFRTISHDDPELFDYSVFREFHEYLEASYPLTHSALARELINEYSLLYTWKGSDPQLDPILLSAHQDVVPVEPETDQDWTEPPFAGRVSDGYIWGRGVMDMKCTLMGSMEAMEMLLRDGHTPRRTVYLAFGHDEEVSGLNGAREIAAVLRSRNITLDYVLDEGLVISERIVPGVAEPVALIGIAEKGNMYVELTVEVEGGSSSQPPTNTSLGILSAAIHRLETNKPSAVFVEPIRRLLEYAAPEMSFPMNAVFANLWLFGGLVKQQLAGGRSTNAAIRTTTAPTMFQGSLRENVLPPKARAVVNFRIRTGSSIAEVLRHVERTIDDPRVEIRLIEDRSFEPSNVSEIDSAGFDLLHRTIKRVYPEVVVAPGLNVGSTDSKHYRALTKNTFRFQPLFLGREDQSRIHGTNERLSIEDYERMIRFYYHVIRGSVLG